MNRADSPKKQAVPFGINGQREDILDTTPAGDNSASYSAGYPAITMTLKAAGGLPPKGQNMNQILFELANVARWSAAGAGYSFDSTFSTTVGGYPSGAKVLSSDGLGVWLNTTDANTANPEVATGLLTGWVPSVFYGSSSISGLASSNVTLTSLQAARERIELSGALTSNINVIVPAWQKAWDFVNNCTGSFTVTVKTASGTGVSVPAGKKTSVYGNGTNVTLLDEINGRLLNVQTFNTTGTYTPTPGTKMIYVEVVGAGGAGAGGGGTSATTLSGGSGGGGGGYASSLLTTVPSSANVLVGVGGVGVANYGSGAPGGSSAFNNTITATGGTGGSGPSSSVANSSVATQSGGGDGGIGSGGNLVNAKGGTGGRSFFTSVNSSLSGDGGASIFSFGPRAVGGTSGPGENGLYGAGGSAALSQGGSAVQKGGNGGNGIVIIWEYS